MTTNMTSSTLATKSWKTLFTKRFPCHLPLLGAPMAGVSGGLLAAETCRAGALGFVAAGYVNKTEQINREVQVFRTKANAEAPLCLGFLSFAVQQNEASWGRYYECLQTHRPDVVQFFAPRFENDTTHKSITDVIEAAKDVNAQVVMQVCSIDETSRFLSGGLPEVDAFMSQGSAAGGHGYRRDLGNSTFPLTALVLSLVREAHPENDDTRPAVLAAGGIVDGRGVAAALALGCDGVVLGTRLWASQEALSHASYKHRLVEAAAPDAVVRSQVPDMIMNSDSATPWPSPYDSIGLLRNESTKQWDHRLDELEGLLSDESSEEARKLKEAYKGAMSSGDPQIAHVHSGEGVGDIRSIDNAYDIVTRINEETIRAIQNVGDLIE